MDNKSVKFPNYTQVKQYIPNIVWHVLRFVSTLMFFALILLLIVKPSEGLWLFWTIFVPFAPLVFFIAPGVWRNVCPLVSANQIPRERNWSKNASAPIWFYRLAIIVQMASLFIIIPARKFLFEQNGTALALVLIIFIVSAFIGGIFLKGKSGWCSTLCPLLPIQKIYGQTPFINIRNYHCRPCVGCVDHCYDFNPAVSYISSLNSKNTTSVQYREFFVASLPGLIYGYFTIAAYPSLSVPEIYLGFFHSVAISSFLFYFCNTFIKISKVKLNAIYGAISLNLFYWFSIPVTLAKYNKQFAMHFSSSISYILYFLILTLTAIWLIRTFKKENKVLHDVESNQVMKVSNLGFIQNIQKDKVNQPKVLLKPSDRMLTAKEGQTLLAVLEENEVPILEGCRMGMCGADPVHIIDGGQSLAPPEENEQKTLNRLGLSPNCRMACSVKVSHNLVVSLKPEFVTERSPNTFSSTPNTKYSWVNQEIKNIVIIGNGIAGMTAAENIKRYHPSAVITVIGKESYDLYNRIAIPRLIWGETSIQNLILLNEQWYKKPYANCMVNTIVRSIDTQRKLVITGTQEKIPYDKLILATGSSTYIPPIKNRNIQGIFTMREAQDAIDIRAYIQQHDCKNPIILGGGLLGIETAYALHKIIPHAVIVHHASTIMNKQIDSQAAHYVQSRIENLGIKIIYNTIVEKAIGTSQVERLQLSDQSELACDILILCTGIQPNIDLAKKANLAVHNGILVNEYMQTSNPDIYAVGDVAEQNGKVDGLWISAIKQAECASINILGGDNPFDGIIPSTILKVTNIDVASMGNVESNDIYETIVVDDHEKMRYKKLIIDNGIIIGAILVGYPNESAAINQAIRSKRNMSQHIDALQADSFDWLGS